MKTNRLSNLSLASPIQVIVIVLALTLLSGCSMREQSLPRAPAEVTVFVEQEPQEVIKRQHPQLVSISIRHPEDLRRPQSLGMLGGRTWQAPWDAREEARFAVQERVSGVASQLSIPDGLSINGAVGQWYISVLEAFPFARAYAKATVRVNLFDQLGQVRYSTEYSGIVTSERWAYSEKTQRALLDLALKAALDGISGDTALVNSIAAGKTVTDPWADFD